MSQSPYPAIITGPPRPSAILRPGQITLPAGMERYHVQGNGALLIEVETGDTVTVRNLEGGQPCELLAWDQAGASDAGVLNEKSNSNGAGLKALLSDGDDSLAALRRGLERRQLQLDKAQAVRVFGGTTPAGTEQSFADRARRRAGGGRTRRPDAGRRPQYRDAARRVRSARANPPGQAGQLAEPLADPVQDIRIKSATAQAYVVKAGEYIQIIDVAGRQCSDFQCFSARKIDKGGDHAARRHRRRAR